MGDRSVGKTSIIKTFMDGRSQVEETVIRTPMMSDFCKIINVEVKGTIHRIKLNIWDAAGDNDVHNLAHLFVRDVNVGILCYGINSKNSFDNLDEWIAHLNENNENFGAFLIGNKSDLSEQRAVPKIHGQRKSKEIENCIMFKETSTFNDVASVMALFDEIGKEVVRQNRP